MIDIVKDLIVCKKHGEIKGFDCNALRNQEDCKDCYIFTIINKEEDTTLENAEVFN